MWMISVWMGCVGLVIWMVGLKNPSPSLSDDEFIVFILNEYDKIINNHNLQYFLLMYKIL